MVLFVMLLIVTLIVLLVYVSFKQSFNYWQRKGLITFPCANVPFGHYLNPYQKNATNMGIMFNKFYRYFKNKKEKHGGVYMITTPLYIPIDLDLIKDIMTRNFDHFNEKGMFFNEELQPVTAHLFQLGGQRWKRLRVKLSPTFTSGKMKMMFPAIVKCTDSLAQSLEGKQAVDVKEICAKFTINVIGACAFGIDCDSYKNTEFHHYGTMVFKTDARRAFSRSIQLFYPQLARWLKLLPFPEASVDFFEDLMIDTVRMREASAEKRNDFMQLLIELKNKPDKDGLTMAEVLAQGWLFFNAGFETSSSTMSFALFELAKDAAMQERCREEVRMVHAKYGEWTYGAIRELKYTQQVIDETLRIYTPLTILNRECCRDFTVDGITIPKGTKVYIPTYCIHMDADYYPNPQKFDPERFTEEAKRNRHSHAYLPFGEGPRLCIGMRFAQMQVRVGIAQLLLHYTFALDLSTPRNLTFDTGFILSSNEVLRLECRKIN